MKSVAAKPSDGLLGQPGLVWVLALLFATLPLVKPPVLRAGGAGVALPDIAVVALWAVAAVAVLRSRLKLRADALLFSAAAYIALLTASAMFGTHVALRTSLVKLAAYSLYLLVPWLTTLILTDERSLTVVLKAFLVGAAVCVLLELVGIAGFYARVPAAAKLTCSTYGLLPSGNYPRMCVTFTTPNSLANYLVLAFAALLAAQELFGRRALFLAAVAACTVAMLFTLSAGFGGFVLVAVIVIWGRLRDAGRLTLTYRLLLVAAGVGAAVFFAITMIAAFVPPGEGHLAIGSRDLRFFHGSRWAIWQSTLETIFSHPLLGKGYGAFVAISNDPDVIMSPDQARALGGRPAPFVELEAHDIWLSVAGQSGLLGLAAFVNLVLQFARRLTFQRASGTLPYLGVSLSAGFIGAFFYHGLFGALEESRSLWPFLGLFMAAANLRERVVSR